MGVGAAATVHRPFHVVDIVDTTGCGDAFDACFVTALKHAMEPETALRFAQASAGLVAPGLGLDAGISSFDNRMKKRPSWPSRS